MKKLLLLSPVVLLLTACGTAFNTAGSDHFGCPGMPDGVVCKTPAAVYKSSHGEIAPTDFDTPIEGTQAARDAARDSADMSHPMAGVMAATGSSGYNPMLAATSPSVARPIREPAQVMRIWYAPWVDKNDSFNGASYKFVEVVNRKWAFGKPESIMGGVVVPYREPTRKNGEESNPTTEVKKTGAPSGLSSPMGPLTGVPGALSRPATSVQQNMQRAIGNSGLPGASSMQNSPQLPSFDLNSGASPTGSVNPFN